MVQTNFGFFASPSLGVAISNPCYCNGLETSLISSSVNGHSTVFYLGMMCCFIFPCLPSSTPQRFPASTGLWNLPSPIPSSCHGPIHTRSSQIHSSCTLEENPGAPAWCLTEMCSKRRKAVWSWASPSPRVPKRREPAGVTWRGRQRLCQCWGHSRTCLHSPHWGAALQSTRRMLQTQRLQKAVKNKQHLFDFVSATTTSRSMQ